MYQNKYKKNKNFLKKVLTNKSGYGILISELRMKQKQKGDKKMRTYKVMTYTTKRGYVGSMMNRLYVVTATSEKHAENIVRKIARNNGSIAIINSITEIN